MSETDTNDRQMNRSEIVFLYDAEGANPNGNPLSANDSPRIDRETQQAIVTDVRLKRYIRDQFEDNGKSIYIRNPQRNNETAENRDELFEDLFDDDVEEILKDENRDVFEEFLYSAIDVRFFGATLSFSESMEDLLDEDEFEDISVPQYTGPLQFSHGRSLNSVVPNSESKKLSTVVTSGGDAEQGTFAEDNRVQYALVRFHGVLNEVAAEYTNLSTDDVRELDNVIWDALRNQTLTRSKMGHNPRFYLRVEYEPGYHNGSLHHTVTLSDESEPDEEMRNINDAVVDMTKLVNELQDESDKIKEIYVNTSKYLQVHVENEVGGPEVIEQQLSEIAPITQV